MLERKYLFPHVIEMNYQAGHPLGVNVYLIDNGDEFILIDIGYEETVDEIIELIRRMDFPLSRCRLLIATHADADHIQGLKRAKDVFKAPVAAHPLAAPLLKSADPVETYARITAQGIDLPLEPVEVDRELGEGDVIELGPHKIEVWHTPGHTAGQLGFKFGELLFSGDNIYRDGGVGVIDAHHGSRIPDFIKSLERIRDDDSAYLLPSHGPAFRRDNAVLQRAIDRLSEYQHLPDFGTCAVDWPLMKEWEADILAGRMPKD